MKTVRTIGKVTLAIIGATLMPVLIWVALGAAVHQQTVPTFGQAVAAGLQR